MESEQTSAWRLKARAAVFLVGSFLSLFPLKVGVDPRQKVCFQYTGSYSTHQGLRARNRARRSVFLQRAS